MDIKRTFELFFFCVSLVCCSFPLSADVEQLIHRVVAKLPHDLTSYTQGLAIEEDQLYESTGLYGHSSLRHLDVSTGQVKQKLDLSPDVFGEGLAVSPHLIFQLTWREQKAFVYDRLTFEVLKILPYSGDGWGLCRDGQTLWMSNGTHRLVQRDMETFAVLKNLYVHHDFQLISSLNALECVGDHLYANVFGKEWIVRIDKSTGSVTGIIDGSKLLTAQEKAALNFGEVFNGIAFRPATGTFFLTGKNWPWIFEVEISDLLRSYSK